MPFTVGQWMSLKPLERCLGLLRCDRRPGSRVLIERGDMLKARFFPDAELNFAENLLIHSGPEDAIISRGEDKAYERWSWDRLSEEVSRLQQALSDKGIAPGDRIAAMMPNMPQTVALMLAATSLGAVWSSCSPDFGEQGVLGPFRPDRPETLHRL